MTAPLFHVAQRLFYGTVQSHFFQTQKITGFSALGSNLTEHSQFHVYVEKSEPTVFDRELAPL